MAHEPKPRQHYHVVVIENGRVVSDARLAAVRCEQDAVRALLERR